jgi:hypothetical protein
LLRKEQRRGATIADVFQSSISTLSTLPLVRRRSIEKAEAQANFSALLAVTDTLGCGDLFEKKALKFIQRLSLS